MRDRPYSFARLVLMQDLVNPGLGSISGSQLEIRREVPAATLLHSKAADTAEDAVFERLPKLIPEKRPDEFLEDCQKVYIGFA